jgi:hypothetical protein
MVSWGIDERANFPIPNSQFPSKVLLWPWRNAFLTGGMGVVHGPYHARIPYWNAVKGLDRIGLRRLSRTSTSTLLPSQDTNTTMDLQV